MKRHIWITVEWDTDLPVAEFEIIKSALAKLLELNKRWDITKCSVPEIQYGDKAAEVHIVGPYNGNNPTHEPFSGSPYKGATT